MQAHDINSIWEQVLNTAKQSMPEALFAIVSTAIIPMTVDANSIHIGVLQGYIKNLIESQPSVSEPLHDSIEKVLQAKLDIVLIDLSKETMAPQTSHSTSQIDMQPLISEPTPIEQSITSSDIDSVTIQESIGTMPIDVEVTIEEDQIIDLQSPVVVAPPMPLFKDQQHDVLPHNSNITTQDSQVESQTSSSTPKRESVQPEFYTPHYDEPVYITRSPAPQIKDEDLIAVPKQPSPQPAQTLQSTDITIDLSASNLNPAYRFDNYITGNANRIPFGAAQHVAENPGGEYNPLFIYGPSGLGKTHLMQAIGNYIIDTKPHMKVMSITSEKFMNLFVESIQHGKGALFRNTFRNIDVLLVDDIQFLDSRHKETKTEFFNTFNELLDNNKQIVLTSDTMPNNMEQFEDRLRSRFQSGFVATMDNPDLETRIAILKAFIERENKRNVNVNMDNESINYIAIQFSENIRELQGAFRRLIGTASMNKRVEPIDLRYTKEVLSELITQDKYNYIDIEMIQDCISSHFNIKKQDLLGKKRKAQFAFPRQIAMYLCREMINESYPQIAQAFSRDHTTILHAYEKISKELDKSEELRETVTAIKSKLTSMTQ